MNSKTPLPKEACHQNNLLEIHCSQFLTTEKEELYLKNKKYI